MLASMRHTFATMALPMFTAMIVGACGSEGGGSGFFDPTKPAGESSSSGQGSIGGGASRDCSDKSAGDQQGCGCAQPSRACWTVPNDLRNTNGCTDGTQTCTKAGEFSTWGACTGEVTSCAKGPGGTGDGSSSSSSGGSTGDGSGDGGKNGGTGDEAGPPG